MIVRRRMLEERTKYFCKSASTSAILAFTCDESGDLGSIAQFWWVGHYVLVIFYLVSPLLFFIPKSGSVGVCMHHQVHLWGYFPILPTLKSYNWAADHLSWNAADILRISRYEVRIMWQKMVVNSRKLKKTKKPDTFTTFFCHIKWTPSPPVLKIQVLMITTRAWAQERVSISLLHW